MDTVEKLLKALPFAGLVKRHPRLARSLIGCLLAILGIALLVNFSYHILLIDRDDVNITRPIPNTSLAITTPQVTHAGNKAYQLFLSSVLPPSANSPLLTATTALASPAPTGTISSTTALTTTLAATGIPTSAGPSGGLAIPTMIRIVGAQGIVLMPQQTMVFTFTPGVYQSYAVNFTNSTSEPLVANATIAIEVNSQDIADLSINQEGIVWMYLRRLFIDNLGAVLFTSITPAIFIIMAFIYDQLEQERSEKHLTDLRNRMSYIEKHWNDENEGKYFLSSVEILDQEHEILPKDLCEQFDKFKSDMIIESIKKCILRGDIDGSKTIYELNNSKVLLQSLDHLKNLVSSNTNIHLECIKNVDEFAVVHLSWLLHENDRALTSDVLKLVLDRHNSKQFVLEQNLYDKIERLFRVRSIQLPPSQEKEYVIERGQKNLFAQCFFHDRMKTGDYDRFIEVLDDYIGALKLNSGNQVVIVTGPPESGKSQLLRRFIQNERFGSAFYVFLKLPHTQTNIHSIMSALQETMLHELFVLLVDHPYLWGFVDPDIRTRLEKVVAGRSYLFNCDPLNYLKSKPLTGSLAWYDEYRRSYIEWLLQCFQELPDGEKDNIKAHSFIGDIGRVLEAFEFTKICLCLEGVSSEFDAVQLLQVVNGYLKQYVYLRLFYNNEPATLPQTAIQVNIALKQEWFEREAWIAHLPKFESEALFQQFKQQITALGDLEPWLEILKADHVVTTARWNEVYDAMARARSERNPKIGNWTMPDSRRAMELLTIQEHGA